MLRILVLLVASLIAVAACGQKGDLYLPVEAPEPAETDKTDERS